LTLPPLLLEWLGALLRAAHVLAGILWIGDSFLFMWMDSSLEQPRADRGRDPKGPEGSNVVGELWMVHSGGFYEVVKRRSLTPAELPPNLYWFKWQSYSTWISGAFLLAVVYWLGGGAMLVDSGSRLTRGAAVLVSAAALVGAWLVYDAACRSPLKKRPALLATLLSLAFAAAVFGLTRVFGARAAWLQAGAMLGTIMAGNVWRVIIPGQAKMLAQTRAGEPVDTAPGVLAKARSTHNHYLTFPVLFLMLSQHFPAGYGHPLGWLVLILVCLAGVVLKYVMNARGRSDWRAVVAGVAAFVAAIVLTARPAPGAPGTGATLAITVPDAQAFAIVERRCTTCHSEHPSNPAFPQAPSGIMLDRPDRLRALAPRVRVRAVETKTMPLGNLTGMTDAERDTLGAWLAKLR
jgi:uncharacterized membrane protein